MTKRQNKPTYLSLFSSAGVGCYGFKEVGFECIATNEKIERRLEVQKNNNKCLSYDGYILGDIQNQDVRNAILKQVERYKKRGKRVDVLIATPPCQGMSVANHKKNDKDIHRNSLVVESVQLIKQILPKFFMIENVPLFCKTGCINQNGEIVEIGQMIRENLGDKYSIYDKVINFKNYGANSSRKRTLMIGVCNELSNFISPLELFPDFCKEKTLYEIIGKMKPLKWGEIDSKDCLHAFRVYPEEMRKWICDLKEGESAFDNIDIAKKPHRIINGNIIVNQSKNGDKYRRQIFNKVAPCIHTRNDQLASQNTIHPKEDRVFSLRELMMLMNIPREFQWFDKTLDEINQMKMEDKRRFLKNHEMNIRQCIGEAVPTIIFKQVALKIFTFLSKQNLDKKEISEEIKKNELTKSENLKKYIRLHLGKFSLSTLSVIAETSNQARTSNSAYFTNKFIINEIMKELPDFNDRETLTIVEPSVGSGNFIPLIFKKYEHIKKVKLTVIDIDSNMLDIAKLLYQNMTPSNFEVKFICSDFLNSDHVADLIVGNPPFSKLEKTSIENSEYSEDLKNLAGIFLEKSLKMAEFVSLVMPKNILNTFDYAHTRKLLEKKGVISILDIGEYGFSGVLIETVNLICGKKEKSVKIRSLPKNMHFSQKASYIFDSLLPYWVIYRNQFFDSIFKKMHFNVFDVFRDRQITNSNILSSQTKDTVCVYKSRNIVENEDEPISIANYDSYIKISTLRGYKIYDFLDRDDVYLTPNMTYYPRMIKKKKGYIVNGSIAILIPKTDFQLNKAQMDFFATKEFRNFYKIARNYQTRTLNIDKTSCFWFGIYVE